MFGPICAVCDKGSTHLDDDGWCDACAAQFITVMETVRCAERSGVCSSRFTCMRLKTCVQIRAAVEIVRNAAPVD